VAAAKSSPINSLWLQPHLDGNVKKLVLEDFFWLRDLRIVMELHRQLFLLLHLRGGCGLLNPFGDFPSTTNNVRPTHGGAAAVAHRRHGLEVEDEGHLKISL
jgi:hypothetical protein